MKPYVLEVLPEDVHYPSSDGKRMAESSLQYEAIVLLHDNIEAMFGEEDEVAVLADNLWYPVEGHPEVCTAPDVMVIFGRPRGHRRSYLQWREGGVAPQVVFEVLSHSNTFREMADKLRFYERHGVEEYYIYDPNDVPSLEGHLRSGDRLLPVEAMSGHVSPRLGIRFDMSRGDLDVYNSQGERFIPFVERLRRQKVAEDELKIAEEKRTIAVEERKLADEERRIADEERRIAVEERRIAEQALDLQRQRAERLAAKLREHGIDPDAG